MDIKKIKEKLLNGEELNKVSIKKLKLPRMTFEHPVKFNQCSIGELDISRATFKETVSFVKCRLGKISAHQATFQKYFTVTKSEIAQPSFFKKAKFEDGIKFVGNSVLNGISFASALFETYSSASRKNPDANFSDNYFGSPGQVIFFKSHFKGQVRFWGSRFDTWAELKEATFEDKADFRSVKFNEGVFFTCSHFKELATFRGSVFELRTDFNECTFDNVVDFSKAKLRDFLYLQEVKLNTEEAGFRFHNMLVERMIVSRETLENRLLSEKEKNYVEATDEYAIIRTNFVSINRFDDEDWAYLKQKQSQRKSLYKTSKNPWKRIKELFEWLVLDFGCGYGTNPWRALRSSLVVVILFASIYYFQLPEMLSPEDIKALNNQVHEKMIAAFNISLTVFTSGYSDIDVVPESDWLSILFPLEYMIGILLLGLFIVSFSRKVIRS